MPRDVAESGGEGAPVADRLGVGLGADALRSVGRGEDARDPDRRHERGQGEAGRVDEERLDRAGDRDEQRRRRRRRAASRCAEPSRAAPVARDRRVPARSTRSGIREIRAVLPGHVEQTAEEDQGDAAARTAEGSKPASIGIASTVTPLARSATMLEARQPSRSTRTPPKAPPMTIGTVAKTPTMPAARAELRRREHVERHGDDRDGVAGAGDPVGGEQRDQAEPAASDRCFDGGHVAGPDRRLPERRVDEADRPVPSRAAVRGRSHFAARAVTSALNSASSSTVR